MPRVAFQGELGAFSHEALQLAFGGDATPVPCRDFRDVGEALRTGTAPYAVLPVENTLAGSVLPSYDVLASESVRVVGEVVLPIHHCVLGVPGATADGLRRILSHPVALAQCTRFLRGAGVEAIATFDTAGAARQVAEDGDASVAAIASRATAGRYGLQVLVADVEDRPDNQTRFLALVRSDHPAVELPAPAPGDAEKSLLVVETDDRPGALVALLAPLAAAGVNLAKIETRPGAEPWTYRFFLEVDADCRDDRLAPALDVIARAASSVRRLGCYSRLPRHASAG